MKYTCNTSKDYTLTKMKGSTLTEKSKEREINAIYIMYFETKTVWDTESFLDFYDINVFENILIYPISNERGRNPSLISSLIAWTRWNWMLIYEKLDLKY